MANYNTLKSTPLINPVGNIDLGSPTNKYGNIYVAGNIGVGTTTINANNIITPKIASIDYPGDDLAANPAGGDTVGIIGTGFQSGATVLLDGAYVSVVTVVSDTLIQFTSPTKVAGSYTLYVVNPDGGTAIFIPGVSYSGVPNWSTSAGTLGTVYETAAVSTTVTATGDAPITYSLYSGTLPPGSSLSSGGVLSGTAPASSGSTTYTFTIRATDAQNQDTDRTFSLTVNTDVVTWNSPANGTSYTVTANSAISNVSLSANSAAGKSITYTANTLPNGISLSGNTIYGTPTSANTVTTLLTATAATTNRSATRTITWTVSLAPTKAIVADAAYNGGSGAGGSGGWVSASTDYVGTTQVFNYSYPSIQSGSGGARTVTLPYGGQKYYIEMVFTSSTKNTTIVGIAGDASSGGWNNVPSIYMNDGGSYGGYTTAVSGGTFNAGDVLNIAYDSTANKVYYGKNGTWSINPTSGSGVAIPNATTNGNVRIIFMSGASAGSDLVGAFRKASQLAYTIPTGYYSASA